MTWLASTLFIKTCPQALVSFDAVIVFAWRNTAIVAVLRMLKLNYTNAEFGIL